MEEREDLTIRIDRYLKGEMEASEREAFEAACKADAALARSLALQAQAEIALQAQAHDVRKAELVAQFDALKAPEARIRPLPSMWPAVAVAAAVVLLFVVFLLLPPGSQALDSQQMYADNLGDRPALSFVRTAGEEEDSVPLDWQAAAEAYNKADYLKAAGSLQALLEDSTLEERPKAQFYLGLSYLWLQDSLDRAEIDSEVNYRRLGREALELVDRRSSFGEKAGWYSALSYIADEQIPEASSALQAITEQPLHYRRELAGKLLEQLTE